jgi:hypothetical protein
MYHTNFTLSEARVGQILGGGMMSDEKKELDQASDAAKKLAIGIMGIAGINTFNFHYYALQVVKAPLFDWEEIEPQIISFIQMIWQEVLNEEVEHIQKPIWEGRKWGPDSAFDEVFEMD